MPDRARSECETPFLFNHIREAWPAGAGETVRGGDDSEALWAGRTGVAYPSTGMGPGRVFFIFSARAEKGMAG